MALATVLAAAISLIAATPYAIRYLSPIPDAQPSTFPPLRPLPDNTIYLDKQHIQRIATGHIAGPEDILPDYKHQYLYTGLSDGRVVRINAESENVETLFYTGMINSTNVQ